MIKPLNWKLLLFFIVLLGMFLRLYMLGSIPAGLTNDEANTGYDAYSLLHTAKDQWGNFLPLHFKAFGDYPAPLYRYIVLPSIAIFGLDQFAIRFPSAVFGILGVLGIFFLLRMLSDKITALFGAFLFAINPWSIGLSRVGIESNTAITILIFALLTFFLVKKNIQYLYLSAILFAITLYTYASYTLFTPIVFIFLLGIFSYKYKWFSTKKMLLALGLFIIASVPLFIGKDTTAAKRFSQIGFLTNTNSIGVMIELNTARGACEENFPSNICKLVFNKGTAFSGEFLKNYFSHFSFDFLYLSGNETQYSILPERGLDYIWGIIFFTLGITMLITTKKRELKIFLLLLILSPIPDALTGNGNYSRAIIMLPFLIIVEAIGFTAALNYFKEKKPHVAKFIAVSFIFISIGSVGFFYINYLSYFRKQYSFFSQYGYKELMQKVVAERYRYQRIYISSHFNDTKQYVYYLFYTQYNPQRYQSKQTVSFSNANNGWISIDKIDNIYFVPIISTHDIPLEKKNYLYISTPKDFPKNIKPVFVIKDLTGKELFYGVRLLDLQQFENSSKFKPEGMNTAPLY